MEIGENDPRNLRAGGRIRPKPLEERKVEAVESIADSLVRSVQDLRQTAARND